MRLKPIALLLMPVAWCALARSPASAAESPLSEAVTVRQPACCDSVAPLVGAGPPSVTGAVVEFPS